MAAGKQEAVTRLRKTLEDCGFELSVPMDTASLCFDLMARKEDTLLIIKNLQNADSQTQASAEELKSLGFFLKGIPLVIGERTTKAAIETGVLYLRHGITIMNLETLTDFLQDGVPPVAFSGPGGFYVEVDGEKLRTLRELHGISYGDLSREVGVSRKSIQMYESGKSATIEIGMRMEDYFKAQIIMPLDPLGHRPECDPESAPGEMIGKHRGDREIYRHLQGMGYKVKAAARCPFDAYTHQSSSVILTTVGDLDLRIKDRLKSISIIADLSHRDALLVTSKGKPPYKGVDIPVVKKEVLKKMEDPDEIMEFIKNY